MRRWPLTFFAATCIVIATPGFPASPAKFSMMKTWSAGSSTTVGKEQIEVADELSVDDRQWCGELLRLANQSSIARKRVDAQREFYLPSTYRLSQWSPIAKPALAPLSQAAAAQSPFTLFPVQYAAIDDCGKPTRKGMLNATCLFDETVANLRPSGEVKIVRMTLIFVDNAEKNKPRTTYYLLDAQGRIAWNLDILADGGQSPVFSFGGKDLFATWSKEYSDFSSGYGGARFRRPKVTLNISSLETLSGYGVVASRRCVLALTPTAGR